MRRTFFLVALLTLSLAFFMPPPVVGFESLLAAARSMYPAITGTMLDNCSLCHTNVPDLNPFGMQFDANGRSFSAVEGLDADGDGFTNLEEIMALTWPGDATSFPSGGGGGGGGGNAERVVARGDLGSQTNVAAASIAPPFKGDQAPVGYVESTVAREPGRFGAARLAGTVSLLRTDPDGDATKEVQVSADVDAEGNVAVTGHKKGEATLWTGADGTTTLRWSKNGKLKKSDVGIAGTAGNVAGAWNPRSKGKDYFVASSGADGGVEVNVVKKNKVQKRTAAPRTSVPEIDVVLGFAAGDSGQSRLLLGGENGAGGSRLVGVEIDNGDVAMVSTAWTGFIADLGASAAYGDDGGLLVAYRDGNKVFTVGVNEDATLDGAWARLQGATASAIAVAPQADGSFLLAWVDADGSVMAVDVALGAGTTTTSDAFELQDATEVAEPGLLSAARVGDTVIVLYATSDGLRTAVVGAPS